MKLFSSLRITVLLLGVAMLTSRSVDLVAEVGDYQISQTPLFIGGNQPPLMMLVMSRDEQLFNKAYSDYTDLNEDGVLDTTYQDTFDYSGYFDPKLCYTYANEKFKASGATHGANSHSCSGNWSGNFMNWAAMSRLDVLRFVLYGGQRITDNAVTILERAQIPNDLHAWTKVYSGDDIGQFTPRTSASTFCNATLSSSGAPLMRVASGTWPEWAATALNQCGKNRSDDGKTDTPTSTTDYTVKVEVCDPAAAATNRESFCKKYSDGTTDSYKPIGLLQSYGETGRLRFGLVSGSYSAPRSGGVLRRNIGKLAGNGTGAGCASGDEIDLGNGRFCHTLSSGAEGIINAISNFRLTQWNYSNLWNDCDSYGILNRQDAGNGTLNNPGNGSKKCSAWGNPLAEMYAEALRNITGSTSATSSFVVGGDLSGLPASVAWKDPYKLSTGGSSYCATCSILVLSSGLSSFDSDEVPAVNGISGAEAATNELGVTEGISGSYFAGRNTPTPLGASLRTHEDICKAFTVTSLGSIRGICPDSPSIEGSYYLSGLAFKAFTTDLRPSLQGKPGSHKNNVRTYTVALAENLPKFEIPVGSGVITLSPLCQANNAGSAAISSDGWRTCFLGSVGVGSKTSAKNPKHVYGRDLKYDGRNVVAGSFSLVWEDSLWGNDHDNDVVSMLSYCVGSACRDDTNPNNSDGKDICWKSDSAVCNGYQAVGDNEVLVRIENLSAYAGNAMLTGFTVTGSDSDGVKRLALRPGGKDGSFLTRVGDPDCRSSDGRVPDNECSWDKPKVLKFSIGNSNTKLLESPLWYAAKYGGFDDTNENGRPDAGEWDSKQAGVPDNYFLARDPSKLKASLEAIFENEAGNNAPTGAGASGARLNTDSFTLDVTFNVPENSNDWTGNVVAFNANADGTLGSQRWSAVDALPGPDGREIRTVITPTVIASDGSVATAVVDKPFESGNLTRAQLGMQPTPPWLGAETKADLVAYLRGDQSREERANGSFRNRSSLIGDIINSTAEVVSPKDDYGYAFWDNSTTPAWKSLLGASYRTYLVDKAAAPKPTVYIGANDGMLHAFDASANGGRERFAFIPSVSRERIAELANPAYVHRYTMDGAITAHDVPFGSVWKTVLVASAGAGGRSVSALNVTDPDAFGDNSVLWELRGTDSVYSGEDDLGYVFGKPVIVPIKGAGADVRPRWVALFGNGINSVNGAPTLYVVDIQTGEVLSRLKPADASYSGSNGLIGVAPVALYNTDGLVDTVYGGDMKGNVWKFDLSAYVAGTWNVAFGGRPLFTATDDGDRAQPITGGLEVSRGPGGGVTVFFGTGQYFAIGDNNVPSDPPVQSLYGILDNCMVANCNATNRIIADRDSILAERTITAGGTSGSYDTRNVSQGTAGLRGWFIDLQVSGNTAKGERFIGTPRLQNGKVFFTTFEPIGDDCAAGGRNWLYGLNLLTGGGDMAGVSTSPGGDSVCTGDCGSLSLGTGAPVKETNILVPPPPPGQLTCPASDPNCLEADSLTGGLEQRQCTLVLRAPGAAPLYLPRPCGRQSWRQVR